MSDEIDAWFAAAGDREQELRRVDALVMAAAPGIDRQLVPVGCRRDARLRADALPAEVGQGDDHDGR